MRAETLHRLANEIIADIENGGIEVHLPKLVEALQAQIDSPSEDTQRVVAETREEIRIGLASSRFNDAPPSEKALLKECGLDHLLGNGLLRRISAAFSGNEITPAAAIDTLKEIADGFQAFYDKSYELINGLAYYEVDEDTLEPGDFEVIVAIPCEAVDQELVQLGREAIRFHQILGVFSEIATGTRESVKVRALASSDLTFILESAPAVAALVAAAIERVVALYERVLTVIKLHRDMKKADVPASALEPMRQHIEKTVKDGLEQIAKQIDKEQIGKREVARRQELKTELRMALSDLASRLDRGYGFDVRGEDVEDSKSENGEEPAPPTAARKAVSEAYHIVEEARPKLRHFQAETEPVLSLAKPANDDGETDDP